MKINAYPQKENWSELVKRPVLQKEKLTELITDIFKEVEKNGDQALLDFNKKFDGAEIKNIKVSKEEI